MISLKFGKSIKLIGVFGKNIDDAQWNSRQATCQLFVQYTEV